jgi:putative endonuclease
LDIVAEGEGVLVFVEVKTRTSLRYGSPEEALNFFKRRALKRACEYYRTAHQCSHLPCRLDLITLLVEPGSLAVKKLGHFRDVPF